MIKLFSSFQSVFVKTLDHHAVRGNHKPHVTKELRKLIMKRSFYKNKFNNTKNISYLILYKNIRNKIVNINKKAKQVYFSSCVEGSKTFWKKCKPFFNGKPTSREKINLLGPNSRMITSDNIIANLLNEYFINIGKNVCSNVTSQHFTDPQQSHSGQIDFIFKHY